MDHFISFQSGDFFLTNWYIYPLASEDARIREFGDKTVYSIKILLGIALTFSHPVIHLSHLPLKANPR
jgi:hypothetical protein